jgi:hypothetical protein
VHLPDSGHGLIGGWASPRMAVLEVVRGNHNP